MFKNHHKNYDDPVLLGLCWDCVRFIGIFLWIFPLDHVLRTERLKPQHQGGGERVSDLRQAKSEAGNVSRWRRAGSLVGCARRYRDN